MRFTGWDVARIALVTGVAVALLWVCAGLLGATLGTR